jgi:hypothetical protein
MRSFIAPSQLMVFLRQKLSTADSFEFAGHCCSADLVGLVTSDPAASRVRRLRGLHPFRSAGFEQPADLVDVHVGEVPHVGYGRQDSDTDRRGQANNTMPADRAFDRSVLSALPGSSADFEQSSFGEMTFGGAARQQRSSCLLPPALKQELWDA